MTRIACSVDRLDRQVIEGWIIDHDAPTQRLAVDVLLGDPPDQHMLGTCLADRFRPDLQQAGIGDGACAFQFQMPASLPDQWRHIRLRLHNSELFLRLPALPREGLWLDQPDWLDRLARRHRRQEMTASLTETLFRFQRDGWVVLPGAVSPQLLQSLQADLQQCWQAPPPGLRMECFEPDGQLRVLSPDWRWQDGRATLLDPHAVSASCRAALATPDAIAFLRALFDATPKIFRSRAGRLPSGLPMQKDTAHVPIADNPLALISCCVALQDMEEGEILLSTGSHRASSFLFGEHRWMNGHVRQHDAYLASIRQQAEHLDHGRETFRGQAGDVLLCHAELAHGTTDQGRVTQPYLFAHITDVHHHPQHIVVSILGERSEHDCIFL